MRKLLLFLTMVPAMAFSQAVLPTLWNFSSPGISTPPAGWTTGLGTNGNLTYSGAANSVGGDNTACRLDATGEYLTIWFSDKPGPLSYWAKGTAISPNPPFTGIFSIEESADGTNWTNLRAFTTASPLTGTMTRYVDNPAATTRYIRFFYTEKLSGSNVALDSVVIKAAPAPAQGFALKQASETLVNGGKYIFGNAASQVFTIQNFGISADLRTDSIVISGANAADFSISAFDSVTPAGATDNFSLLFNPGANGSRFATLKVYSTDAERSPFTLDLYAIGGALATEPSVQVPALQITNVKTHTFNVNFNKAAGAERYIVLRKQASSITETPVDGVTYMRGDYIGGAQVAYIGDDSALIRPNYIFASTDYSFAAFAFNGPAGYENYHTANPAKSTTTTLPGQPGTYYNTINPLLPSFISDLQAKIKSVDTVFYGNYAPVVVNGFLARDTTGGKKVVTCVYTNDQYDYADPFTWWTGQGNNPATLTREHTFAQSWMPSNDGSTDWERRFGGELPEFNDLHHIFPADQTNANSVRSNLPFGVVVNVVTVSPTGLGKKGTNANGVTVYEPKDDQKGNLARALFYMLVRYDGLRGFQWRLPATQDINVLLQWHQQDPPDALEIARNEYVATTQKNRNPFIDHPEWVNRINFANMTFIPDPSAEIIDLTLPSVNATYIAGTTQNIVWSAQNVDTVVIEYRVSPASPWTLVTDTVPGGRGVFAWVVPNTPTNTASVRISEKNNGAVTDSTAGTFIIDVPRSITLTNPTGAQTWVQGRSYTVSWTHQNVDTILVQIRTGSGDPYTTLGKIAASEGSFSFNLTSALTTDASIRVIQVTRPSIVSTTSGITIVKATVDITQPAHNNVLEVGNTYTVKWTKSNVDSVNVAYRVRTAGGEIDTVMIGTDITADSLAFTVGSSNLYADANILVYEVCSGKLPDYLVSDTAKIMIIINDGLSENNAMNRLVKVYPVPSEGPLYVEVESGIRISMIEVYDATGRMIDQTPRQEITIQTKGIYLFRIITDKGIATKRVVIQ